jgi:uncharacterized protein YjbI with pentapeptide repeats
MVSGVVTVAPAGASTVIDGCVVVAHPNAGHHTRCPGADLAAADLSGLDLNYADLAGADLSPLVLLPGVTQTPTNLDDANLSHANLTLANLTAASTTGADLAHLRWMSTICPDGTNSNDDGNTCINNLG